MSNETNSTNSLIKIPELPPSVDNALKNLTDEPTKNVGHTLGDIWYLVFGGVSQAAKKKQMKYDKDLEKYYQELNQKTDEIPNECRIEPSLQVTAQALENSKYCISSEILRKMFVNLISGSMNKCLEPHVHPSFPEILKQLSENDARFIQTFKQESSIPIANIGIKVSNLTSPAYAKDVCVLPNLSLDTTQCCISISSLRRAGLLETTYIEWFANDSMYDKIKATSIYKSLDNKAHLNGYTVNLEKGMCRLTNLGKEFVKVCV